MLVSIVIAILLAGVVAFLIDRAPFIEADYKAFAKYAILVVVVLYVLACVFGGPSYHFPSPRWR